MTLFNKPRHLTIPVKKKDIPKGLWTKCPASGEIVFNKELEDNLMVVPKSGYHFPLGAHERIDALLDQGAFVEVNASLSAADTLHFTDTLSYRKRLARYQHESGLIEAVVCGTGEINGMRVSVAIMDFRFCGGSMGAAVGEKITRTIEIALAEKIPCIIFSASGGARMQEGIFSLMQMAKTSAALGKLAQARIPFVSVLTHPTMGGVTASFATLGDVILAEPGALVGFAGARVIKDTTRQTLPPDFQTAEFLLEHGLIDQIVSRHEMRDRITALLLAFGAKEANPKTQSAEKLKNATIQEGFHGERKTKVAA